MPRCVAACRGTRPGVDLGREVNGMATVRGRATLRDVIERRVRVAVRSGKQAGQSRHSGRVGHVKRHVLILGAGFGGLELATRLSETMSDTVRVTLLDRNDSWYFGFSKLDVM